MTTRSLLAIAALALSVVACGSDGPTGNDGGNNGVGSFSGQITGALTKSITGQAVFGTSAVNDGFGLVLGNEDDGIILGRELAGLLAVGVHDVFDLANGEEEDAPAADLIGVIGLTINGADHICAASGGTVTVTSSSATRMAGSLNITAECVTTGSQAPKAITITGNFSAVGGSVD
jgi:hypothetical protein